MLNRPNPLILVMGGGSFFTCVGFVGGSSLPTPVRYGAMAALGALGLASVASGFWMFFANKKKPATPEARKRKAREVTLGPATAPTGDRPASSATELSGTSARRASPGDRSPPGGS